MTLAHRALVVSALVLAGCAAVAEALGPSAVSAVTLAPWIADGRRPQVLDVRAAAEFASFHIPSAAHTTFGSLLTIGLPRQTPTVVYSDGPSRAVQAGMLLQLRGHGDVSFLRDGVYEWLVRVQEPQLAVDATPAERADFEQRAALSRYFGGQPHLDVPRSELATGPWVAGASAARAPSLQAALLVAAIRRRGC